MKQLFKNLMLIFVVMIVSASMIFSGQTIFKKKTPVLMSLIKVDLVPTAKYYMGVCPVTVKMKGTIKVPKALTVKYYFLRSDGATSSLTPIIFRTAGSKNINFSWQIGKDYSGWVQLIVKSPSVVKSAKIGFQVKCKKNKVFFHKQLQLKQNTINQAVAMQSIRVIYPNGGEELIYMRHHAKNYIKWRSINVEEVVIWLLKGNNKVHQISLSDLGEGGTWYCGWDTTEFTQRFYPGDNYKIRIESRDGKVFDESDDFFTIKEAN